MTYKNISNVPDEVDDYFEEVLWQQCNQVNNAYNYLIDSQFSIISKCELCGEHEPYCATHSYIDGYQTSTVEVADETP